MIVERLKDLRIAKNLSQPDMAKILNTPLATYRSYEYGKREPNHELLVKISNILDTSIDYLLGNENAEHKPLCDKPLTQDEENFINNFLSLTPDERSALLKAMHKIMR